MNELMAIVGPTGIGKSRIGLEIAKCLGGEIINADSRQVYRFMDIGTGKPSAEELLSVTHHMVNIVDPDQDYNLGLYNIHARQILDDIHARGRFPILVGGTGQYVWGLLNDFDVPNVPPNLLLRSTLLDQAFQEGGMSLWNRLARIDPIAARNIDYRNIRRIVRALEVFIESGRPFSAFKVSNTRPVRHTTVIGLTMDRKRLYERIDARVDDMVSSGWSAEVEGLIGRGYSADLPSMSSIGYRQMVEYIHGELSLCDAIARTKVLTHRLARRQYAWFRLSDSRIHWLDVTEGITMDMVLHHINNILGKKG